MTGDRGSGTVLVLGVLGAIAVVTMLLMPVALVCAARQRAAAAADAAALAGADAALGLAVGTPCELAARVAVANGATLARCEQRETRVAVETRVTIGVFTVPVEAVAGPP